MKLILASNSPRRREILKEHGFDFTVIKSGYEEKPLNLSPTELVKTFAFNKAKDVFDGLEDKKDFVVLGADTVVVLNGVIIGKPKDKDDAFNTLRSLSGRIHKVITGYTLISEEKTVTGFDETAVEFNDLSDEYIKEYIDNKKPFDKAGSYGIQDGYHLVKGYNGSYNNIVGLPIEKIKEELKGF